MPKPNIAYQPSADPECKSILGNVVAFGAILHGRDHELGEEAEPPAQSDEVARDLAAIQQAAAALRNAEPGLQTWTAASGDPLVGKPYSVWRSIGLVWFSSVLIAAGTLAAIAHLAGQAAHRIIGG